MRMKRNLKRRGEESKECRIFPFLKPTLSTLAATGIILTHEIQLQKSVTGPPQVYIQDSTDNPEMKELQDSLLSSSLSKDIKPALFVGTRSILASTAAYLTHGPAMNSSFSNVCCFREILQTSDGARLALDWQVPCSAMNMTSKSDYQVEKLIRDGPITAPIVIILHGINNDTSFGYMKQIMKEVTESGWIACGMNFRGCGGVPMTTPRGYNAAYTGDLRFIIHSIQDRLSHTGAVPIFLVGHSLGANLVTKYLGEEGYHKTLPKCIFGAVTLGNPLQIHSENVPWPFNYILALGVKKTILQSWNVFRGMSSECAHFSQALKQVLLSKTIGQLDHAMAPFLIRNEPDYPFSTQVGFENGEEYWKDASSNRYIQHVSVPLLKLFSEDDFLVVNPALKSLGRCLENPNVIVVKTKCGGHLGWQEAPLDTRFGIGSSWSTKVTSDFIQAVLKMRKVEYSTEHTLDVNIHRMNGIEDVYASNKLKSKL